MVMMAIVKLTVVSHSLQQAICRKLTDTVQRNAGRSFTFDLQQLQVTVSSDSHQPEAADAPAVDRHLLPDKATGRRTC